MKYHFVIPAQKYFEQDIDRLKQLDDGDVVEVLLDVENRTAEFGWRSADEDCPPMWEEDGYEGALEMVLSHFGTGWEGV